ncbi:MAG: Gfo/Idh/MocA family oxidoreductase [Phycisphaerae bacterium]|jgi:predicted dehydrogenase|nr:Gfo/Idh/MocA family oxidoreductase [Phycisphaerae bacterium]MDP7287341.1 Gfo/Idh/MocA family oxidoreductase [Phycisphaerae bacterium]
MKEINVALIGCKFMGKAHSNAWKNAPHFFDMNLKPVLKVVCDTNEQVLGDFARKWGWEETETDWRKLIARDDIDVIDIATPPDIHCDIAVAAAEAGKHVFCEKPIARNSEEAARMNEAAEKAGIVHYLNHEYRRCPAIALAKQLIDEGRVGRIFHWRGAYLQSWLADPDFPLTWHLQKETAGSGPQNGINSHSVDLARYLVGEIKSVVAMQTTFVNERPLAGQDAGTFNASAAVEDAPMGKVTVEDAISMIVEFENGALGSFEATSFATGRKNYNYFEIYGDKGSLIFDLERMNELQFFSVDDPEHAQGFRTILATEACHKYMANWWPPGHSIGFEHEFHHGVVDFLDAIDKGTSVTPSFLDGLKGMEILEAGLEAARTGTKISLGG